MSQGPWALNVVLLLLHLFLGGMILAHGYAKIFRGGRLAGTARWFESIGMRPGQLNAYLAATTEVGTGVLLILGFATPLVAGSLTALMVVAIVTVHRFNGFFVYNKGQGVEYCSSVIAAALALGAFGSGKFSLDFHLRHLGIEHWLANSSHGLLVATIAGFGGAGLQLLACYRPGLIPSKKSSPV